MVSFLNKRAKAGGITAGKEIKSMKERLSNLLTIKSIVTVLMTIAFIYQAMTGKLDTSLLTIYTTIIAFYFGTQTEKLKSNDTAAKTDAATATTDSATDSTAATTDNTPTAIEEDTEIIESEQADEEEPVTTEETAN